MVEIPLYTMTIFNSELGKFIRFNIIKMESGDFKSSIGLIIKSTGFKINFIVKFNFNSIIRSDIIIIESDINFIIRLDINFI